MTDNYNNQDRQESNGIQTVPVITTSGGGRSATAFGMRFSRSATAKVALRMPFRPAFRFASSTDAETTCVKPHRQVFRFLCLRI